MSIRARGVSKRYGTREALRDVHFDLDPGTFVLVSGPNGAGKSTLLRCIAGVSRHEGRILRNGSTGAHVAYLPQGDPLPPSATVAEILRLFGAASTLEPPFDGVRQVCELSGGERRRLALSALLSLSAPLVVLDEPLADLDAGVADAVLTRLAEQRDSGATIVVAAPDGDARRMARVCDRVVRLERGTLTEMAAEPAW